MVNQILTDIQAQQLALIFGNTIQEYIKSSGRAIPTSKIRAFVKKLHLHVNRELEQLYNLYD